MKILSIREIRKNLDEILDEVQINSETFILERAGKPIAKLVPLVSEDSENFKNNQKMKELHDLRNLCMKSERSEDPDTWLQHEREEWD